MRPFVSWCFTSYTFTDRRFIQRTGFIAREGRTIPLNRISGVDFEVGVIDRLFGCGTLVVSDASEQGRVELHDIPRVEHVQMVVAEELHRLAEGPDRRGATTSGAMTEPEPASGDTAAGSGTTPPPDRPVYTSAEVAAAVGLSEKTRAPLLDGAGPALRR